MVSARLAALLLIVGQARALFFNVPASGEECVREDAEKGSHIHGSYQVADGGSLDIDVRVKGPGDRIYYDVNRQSEGKFKFTAESDGVHSLCFSNKMSSSSDKIISFVLHIGEQPPSLDEDVAKDEHVNKLESSVLELAESLTDIEEMQRYMRTRERVHRDTTESTNARVQWWSVFETFVLFAMSLWQIVYLKRFFEVKRVV